MAATPVEGAVGGEKLRRDLAARPPRKILIEARDHVGDAVNTTGAVAAIVERFPGAEIILEVGAGAARVYDNFPGLKAVWPRKRHQGIPGKIAFAQKLRRERFDLAIILDDSNEKIRLTAMGNVPMRVGVRKTKHFELYSASIPFDRERHDLFDSLRGVLGLLGCRLDLRPRLYPSAADREAANDALEGIGGPIVLMHVAASEQKKQWPIERFNQLAAGLLNVATPVFIAGPGEGDLLAKAEGCPVITKQLTILQYAALLEEVQCLVTGDTGPAHVAAAVGIPAVVLYGPTDPHRFHPFGTNHKLLYHAYGCSFYDGLCAAESEGRRCDNGCMRSIAVDEVQAAVMDLLGVKP